MRRIVLRAPGRFEIEDAPAPEPGPGEVLLRIRRVGVCGSDLHLFRRGTLGGRETGSSTVIGHECTARVEALGRNVDAELKGTRVSVEPALPCGECRWCRTGQYNVCPDGDFLGLPPTPGALQDYLVHPAHRLHPLPDDLSDEAGVVLEPMAIALHALKLAKVRPGQSVAILGTGVVGTCVLELLGLYGATRIVCADLVDDRLERARRMGADGTVNATGLDAEEAAARVRAELPGRGADVVFECCGEEQTLWNMCEVAAPLSHVVVVGSNRDDRVSMASSTARRRGLTLRFVRRSLHTLEPAMELAREGHVEPEKLATHVLPADRTQEAFEVADERRDGVLKAIVDMTR